MLLADKQIRELCLPPNFMISELMPSPQSPNCDVFYLPTLQEYPSYLSEIEIINKINDNKKSILIGEQLGIKSYRPLDQNEVNEFKPMISPYCPTSVNTNSEGKKIPSYGKSSYGYDVRIGRNFKLFKQFKNESPYLNPDPIIDILDFSATEDKIIEEINDVDFIEIPPHGFVLGHTVEKIQMPKDVTAICMGKSTIARSGLSVLITPIEAAWSGYITIEISNMTSSTIRLYSGIGICQLLFLKGDVQCATTYADRSGKYQDQKMTPVTPKN